MCWDTFFYAVFELSGGSLNKNSGYVCLINNILVDLSFLYLIDFVQTLERMGLWLCFDYYSILNLYLYE